MTPTPQLHAVQAALEGKPGAFAMLIVRPPGVVRYKLMGKMFAILSTRRTQFVILKCDPHLAELMREQYVGVGHRTHLDRRFWIAVDLDSDVPTAEILRLIDASYELVCGELTRKQRAELSALPA